VLKLFFETIRSAASGLATVIEWQKKKDYVLRPWTEEENADFEKFCDSIGKMPEDPEHAASSYPVLCRTPFSG
jgi:hypothetical protein